MNRVKKGDNVKVIAGTFKGKVAEIENIKGDKVFLKGLNVVERHYSKNAYTGGGKKDVHLGIHISNVALVTEDGQTTKVAYQNLGDKKVRVAKVNNKEIK